MPAADLYVVALQEIVELTGTNYVFSSEEPINAWRKLLTDTFTTVNKGSFKSNMTEEQRQDETFVYTDTSMFGLYLAVFFKRRFALKINPRSF